MKSQCELKSLSEAGKEDTDTGHGTQREVTQTEKGDSEAASAGFFDLKEFHDLLPKERKVKTEKTSFRKPSRFSTCFLFSTCLAFRESRSELCLQAQ